MRIRLIRHATLIVEYNGHTLIVDPMLDEAGARPAIEDSPNPRKNPLVPLPVPATDFLPQVEAILVTHTHSDHWDASAASLLNRDLPLFGQPQDTGKFHDAGFRAVLAIGGPVLWKGTRITRTAGQHGTGEIGRKMAPVSGFVLQAAGEPTLYIAGDTIWCPEVEEVLREFRPAIVVVNAGAAQFLQGGAITMTAADVISVCQSAPNAHVIAVHMEAINHCLLTRSDLEFQLEAARVLSQVAIPGDGEWAQLNLGGQ